MLNKIYLLIEKDIKEKFIPLNLKKVSEEVLKKVAKNFIEKVYGDGCSGLSCSICPLKNKSQENCLPVILFELMQKKSKKENFYEFQEEYAKNPSYIFCKAAEFYLKHYCEEYEQEEMDI
jgi:hypothetical protein